MTLCLVSMSSQLYRLFLLLETTFVWRNKHHHCFHFTFISFIPQTNADKNVNNSCFELSEGRFHKQAQHRRTC